MLEKKELLHVFHDDNGTFKDYFLECQDFGTDTFTLNLNATEDYLYLGIYKPFSILYFAITKDSENTTPNSLTVEFYLNGSWSPVTGLIDHTRGFTRSGFIQWDRNNDLWTKTTINSVEKFWIRIRPSADHTDALFKGINILFADDLLLKEEIFEIEKFLPENEKDFVLFHQAARKEIVSAIRSKGHSKTNLTGVNLRYLEILKQITEWDLLNVDEVVQIAKNKALEKILLTSSDKADDKYSVMAAHFRKKAQLGLDTLQLSLDIDDDGLTDNFENMRPTHTSIEVI